MSCSEWILLRVPSAETPPRSPNGGVFAVDTRARFRGKACRPPRPLSGVAIAAMRRGAGMTVMFCAFSGEPAPRAALLGLCDVTRLHPEIGAPDFRHRCEDRGQTFGEHPSLGKDIGVIAHRQRKMHVLFDQKNGQARFLERLERHE